MLKVDTEKNRQSFCFVGIEHFNKQKIRDELQITVLEKGTLSMAACYDIASISTKTYGFTFFSYCQILCQNPAQKTAKTVDKLPWDVKTFVSKGWLVKFYYGKPEPIKIVP